MALTARHFLISSILMTSTFVFADELYTVSNNPDCKLKKMIDSKWVDADRSEIKGITFKLRQYPGTDSFAFKLNNVWYGGPQICFEIPGIASTEAAPPAVEEKKPEPKPTPTPTPTQKAKPEKRVTYNEQPASIFERDSKYGIELDGEYWMPMGTDYKVGDSGGVTKSSAANFMGGGLKINYAFKPKISLWFAIHGMASSQTISILKTSGTITYGLVMPEFGARIYLSEKRFRPYIGLGAGYAMMSSALAVSTLGVNFSGSAIALGLMAGADFSISRKFDLVFEAGVRSMTFSSYTVSSSSDSVNFPAGAIYKTSVNPISALLGIRFNL